jgi:hypothetical protein
VSDFLSFNSGKGTLNRRSHSKPVTKQNPAHFPVQASSSSLPTYPFQPLPTPNGPAPYRYDLSQLLPADYIATITGADKLVFHTVGDTGDYRGRQQDFVAALMTADASSLPDNQKPAFLYHLGDVVYFAGDIDKYGDNFYETYKDYPCFIVAIPGNHDCQPDDPQDGPVDPNKKPLDGFVQNFMSPDPTQPGSFKTGAARTQMDLPNVYWTFTTPYATIIGLFSNVGESQGAIHADQIAWFEGELQAANPDLALIVTVHHPAFSGDDDHSGSTEIETVLSKAFKATGVYPHLILHGHVHNYQRFTQELSIAGESAQIPFIIAGAGGYTNLGKLHKVNGEYPTVPLALENGLTLEQYDQDNFGFLRFEVTKSEIIGSYFSAPYSVTGTPTGNLVESFVIDIQKRTVTTQNQ